jgi:hypothetical protein
MNSLAAGKNIWQARGAHQQPKELPI